MKNFILVAALFCSVPAFAQQLIAEVQCTGIIHDNEVTITAYVNENKFCSARARNLKSSVVINDGSLGSAFNTLANESRGILRYTSGSGRSKMELKMNAHGETGTFLNKGKTTKLECVRIEYEMEC